MQKHTIILLITALITTTVSAGYAASGRCIVTSVEENKVILDCGDDAKKFKKEMKVKIKTTKKRAAVEGC